MSTTPKKGVRPAGPAVPRTAARTVARPAGIHDAPLLGALLRIAHEAMTQGMLAELRARGVDMTETEYKILRYPGPDGTRPVDLAQRCNMSRQAMNYVLANLERRGIIERRALQGQTGRRVFATSKGRQVYLAMRASVTAVEKQWAAHLGARRSRAMRAALHDIAAFLEKA